MFLDCGYALLSRARSILFKSLMILSSSESSFSVILSDVSLASESSSRCVMLASDASFHGFDCGLRMT